MAVRIRSKRVGAHKAPFYRVVVVDSGSPRDEKFIEEIGYYDPIVKSEAEIKIGAEKATKWLGDGAQPAGIVKRLLDRAGTE